MGDTTHEEISDLFNGLTTVKTWAACEELHDDQGRHFHVIVFLHKKLRSRNSRYFDLVTHDMLVLHPNAVP